MLVRGVGCEVKRGASPDGRGTLFSQGRTGTNALSCLDVVVTEPDSLASPSSSSRTFWKAILGWELGQRDPQSQQLSGLGW